MWNCYKLKFLIYFKTLYRIGLLNCFSVFIYRLFLRIKFYKILNKIVPCPIPEKNYRNISLNSKPEIKISKSAINDCVAQAAKILNGYLFYYGKFEYFVSERPNWFLDYKNLINFPRANIHWSDCRDTSKEGDIKECWEISRWNWAPTLARAFLLTGKIYYLKYLDNLIENWCQNNACNGGINWLCGQEISIRLINAMLSWKLLDSNQNNLYPNLLAKRIEFTVLHLKRIKQTIYYAKAQSNNHWITESAALFIGGNWLMQKSNSYYKDAKNWADIGRKELEKSLEKLVLKDGSFTQQSITYHRFVLDILSQVEIWRNSLNLIPLNNSYQKKFTLLINWLYTFVDRISGDAPNLGANDGSYCFQLHDLSPRDFRPTLQLCSSLSDSFENLFYDSERCNEPLIWLNQIEKIFKKNINLKSKIFYEGGYINFQSKNNSWGLLRLPKYSYRPSQNDPLHFDFWYKGINILRDGGSYSYNASKKLTDYFSGIESHNTIQFKGNEQMIRFGRFLMGSKINFPNIIESENNKKFAMFKTYYHFEKNCHERIIIYRSLINSWEIVDIFRSSKKEILLRWRLAPIKWKHIKSNVFESSLAKFSIFSNNKIISCKLVNGLESRYYSEKKEIPVIELIISGYEGKIKTVINTL